MNNLITAGELAKLASTTKRTIHFYDEKGVLKPVKTNKSKYRLYEQKQVLDYQMILLLSSLGIPLNEIKIYLKKKGDLSLLFNSKKELVQKEIERLQFGLDSLSCYLKNLEDNGTMVDPEIKTEKPFDVYYIDKVGSYSKIGEYCKELVDMFASPKENFVTLSIFDSHTYQPKDNHIKTCAFVRDDMKIKTEFQKTVKRMTFNPGKIISHTYYGSGSMLSLFWKELEKYCKLNGIKERLDIPDYEIYWEINDNPIKQKFEICLPIE